MSGRARTPAAWSQGRGGPSTIRLSAPSTKRVRRLTAAPSSSCSSWTAALGGGRERTLPAHDVKMISFEFTPTPPTPPPPTPLPKKAYEIRSSGKTGS